MARWLPFRLTPASWGLVGDAYDEAEAHYTLEGEALERRLIEIRYKLEPETMRFKLLDHSLRWNHIDEYEHHCKFAELAAEDEDDLWNRKLEIDVDFGKIDPFDAAVQRIERKHPEGLERDLAVLDLNFQHGRIERNAYEKQKATMTDQPWVGFINSGFDPNQGIDGVFFELDWNTQWVEYLRLHGFSGKTEEEIVEDWFSEVCRSYGQSDAESISVHYPMGFDAREK